MATPIAACSATLCRRCSTLWGSSATITHVAGVPDTATVDLTGIPAAAAAAKAAEIAIVFVGLTPCNGWGKQVCNEGESHDRNEHFDSANKLELPGSQQALVEAVAVANPRYVVVFINGGALGTDWIAEHSPAVVEAFYPGELGGDAIIDVLTGAHNPTGTLPVTIYPAAFGSTRPITDMSLRGGQGITHLHYTGTPLWPFGHSSSYTTFALSTAAAAAGTAGDTAALAGFGRAAVGRHYSLTLTNTGGLAGGFTVLGFITSDDAPGFPLQVTPTPWRLR